MDWKLALMNDTSRPLPFRLKLVHGFGAVAFGVKDIGFSFFLLIYYNQVLGMEAALVSAALLIALLVDAVVDPIIGNLSDRTYTRWGRRLPWLYCAPIPLALAWIVLWSPPSGEAPSFIGLLALTIAVRTLLSACEVPSTSLVPEITSDYDERTTLFRFRYLSGWTGGLLMMVLAYTVFMSGPDGLLKADGYAAFGIFGAGLMALSVIGSAAGQHSLVARLPATKPPPFSLKVAFSEIAEAFSERSFLIFAAGGLAAYISQGMYFSISNYLNLFIWQIDGPIAPQLPIWFTGLIAYPVVLFLSVVLMFFIVGPMHATFGKAKSAVIGALGGAAIGLTPFALLLAGIWPAVGTPASTIGLLVFLLFGNTLGVVTMISATSMIAEIVEAFEERTHRRAEGAFYSGNWLVQKCATGVGIFVTGLIISASGLQTDASPGTGPQDVIRTIILYFGAATMMLAGIAAFWLGRFPINRDQHAERLLRLTERRGALIDDVAQADPDAHSLVP